MFKRILSILMIAAGALLILVSLLADTIGVGAQPASSAGSRFLGP